MAKFYDICFVNLTLEQAKTIREWVDEGYSMRDYPTRPDLKYVRSDQTQKTMKLSKCKVRMSKKDKYNAVYCYEQFEKSPEDHLHKEVGKLLAITGANLPKREDQLAILRQTFKREKNN